jgi:hypothetical protein
MAHVPGTYDNDPNPEPRIWDDPDLTAEQLDNYLNQISNAWEKFGLHPSGLQLDVIPTVAGISVLIDHLIERGFINEDKINLEFKREMLRMYTEHLETVITHMQQQAQKIAQENGIAVPQKGILLPDGRVIGGKG